jgi:UDP-glucose 4-epimerase
MKNIIIIGSHGFIGRNLYRYLNQKDHQLYLIDLFPQEKVESLPPRCHYLQGPIWENKQTLDTLSTLEIDCAYYLASTTVPQTSWDNIGIEIEQNLTPFIRFIEWAGNHKVKRIAFVSSGGTVYGDQTGRLVESSVVKPFSPYGIFKLTMENILKYAEKKHGIKHDIYRVSNVYGPEQPLKTGFGVINTWLNKVVKNEPITIFGNGENVKDYICIDDVVTMLGLSTTFGHDTKSDTYNVSSSETVSLLELLEIIKEVTEKEIKVQFEPSRTGDNQYVVLDNQKIIAYIKDHDFTTLRQGIKKTFEVMLKNETVKVS